MVATKLSKRYSLYMLTLSVKAPTIMNILRAEVFTAGGQRKMDPNGVSTFKISLFTSIQILFPC